MKTDNIRKIRLLKIWEILTKETDEEHPIESVALMDKIHADGIPVDRKTLYSDIEALNEFGYEVLSHRGKRNEYFVANRMFDNPEIQILMDAVQAASFITEKKTKMLVDKISLLAGSEQSKVLQRHIVWFDTPKSDNEKIYYSVNEISTAIATGKKIGFYYCDYDLRHKKVRRKHHGDPTEDRWYIVNPVATAYQNNWYYLFCYNDTHGTVTQYRVDRMENVTVLSDDITPNRESKNFNLKKHKKTLFGMYGGTTKKIRIEADKELLNILFDQFGADLKIEEKDEDTLSIRAEVQISAPFFGWVATFGNRLKIAEPVEIQEQYKQFLLNSLQNY